MLNERFSLMGKTAIVTGAGKGIGRGVAKALANLGVRVAVTARSIADLESLVAEIEGEGGKADAFPLDMYDVTAIQNTMDRIYELYGDVDILVNNAGIGRSMPALDVTEADWDDVIDLNLKGMFFCSQAVAKRMTKRGSGKIINMSSQASVVAIPKESVYCTSKGGVNQLTKALALEWGKFGVRVNAIGPTFIYTPGTAERLEDEQFRSNVLSKIPLGKVGTIEDVAGAVVFLSSEASNMMTGTLLLVDGGWTIE